MKKLFPLILLYIFFISGCQFALEHDDSILLFGEKPLTKETILKGMIQNTFKEGQLVHYGFYSKEPFKTTGGRVQILKKDQKTDVYGFSIEQSFDIHLNPDKNYYTNSFTIYSEGLYFMRIFTKNSPNSPIAQKSFWIIK